MDHAALRAFIDTEPSNAGRTDAQVLAWGNEIVTGYEDIPWLEFHMWIREYQQRPVIADKLQNGTGAEKAGAQFMIDTINAGKDLLASDSRVRATIAACIPAGAARSALIDLGARQVKRWAAAGLSTPILGDITVARAL